ncbi:MAG: protease complex subunit PrcB family protein [Bacillota bacterium]
MRKMMLIALALVLALSVAGCGGVNKSNPGSGSGGITYNKIPFEKVEPGQEPPEVARELGQMREKAATKTVVKDGFTYAIVTAGEKSSGGWDVTVGAVGDIGGQIEVIYRTIAPKPGSVNTAAITYPSVVVKFENAGNLPVVFREEK